jgi:branched-chain amino acid transport system substrate-binding protein
MFSKKLLFSILLSLLLILTFTGISIQVFAEQVETVKVGVILPLSGNIAQTGNLNKQGMELALDVVNNKYEDLNVPMAETEGFPNFGDAKLEFIFMDDQNNPEKGMSAVEQLITQRGVCAVMGSEASSVTATASQAAERLGVPYLAPWSSSPRLTERGFEWFFRSMIDDDLFTKNFFEFMIDIEEKKDIKLGKTIALLYENTLWGSDIAIAVRKYAQQFGYELIEDLPYTARSASLTSEIVRLKGADADIVMLASYVSDAILIQKTMKDLDYIPPVILVHGSGHTDPNFISTLGDLSNYIISRDIFTSTLIENPTIGQVNEMMIEKTGQALVNNNSRGFMGALVIADAISRAKSLSPEDIRTALRETDIPKEKVILPWDGIKFNEKGQLITGRAIMAQILNQKYEPIWPFEIASEEAVLPIPSWDER